MKVKDLLKNIEEYRKKYPDIDNWEVYTEQPDSIAPLNYVSFETYLQEMENNCTEWEISNDYLKLVRNSFNTFKETF